MRGVIPKYPLYFYTFHMFSNACKKAHLFTQPIVMSKKLPNGSIGSGIGTYFFVNREGYAVTVAHVFKDYMEEVKAGKAERRLRRSYGERGPGPEKVERGPVTEKSEFSFWFGADNILLEDLFLDPEVDIAIMKLTGFDRGFIKDVPVFRDPDTFETGTSLCRLGFPFVTPKSCYQGDCFHFYGLPMPFFPNDGMHTRVVNMGKSSKGYDRRYVETTTPGLKGQSGGPIFDTEGRIYAMQSRTVHIPLGFEVGNQFMNIGLGVHGAAIQQILDDRKVKYIKETDVPAEKPEKKSGWLFH